MRQVEIDQKIRSDPYLLGLVGYATEVLDLEVSVSQLKDEILASWALEPSELGSKRLSLTISGDGQSVIGKFIPADLEDRSYVQRKMVKLWGDFLQARSHKQLQEMNSRLSFERVLDGSDALERIIDSMTAYSEREGREPVTLKLPVRYAAALMKLGPQYWGDFYQGIRKSGLKAFAGETLLGMKVELVTGADATLEVV